MNFPLWRYGAYAFAIAATLCLAAANVAWAWSLDDGVYRYVMIVVSVAADVGAPCALMAMMHYQAESDPTSALAAFVVWAFCGYAEIKGAEVWLRSNSFVISAPALKATEAQKAASVELEAEAVNLTEIRKLLASERREAKLDALQRREKASLERLEKLRPQTFVANVEPARSQYVGNELALAFALWLLSQVAWKMAIGRMHGTKSRSDKTTVLTVRPTVVEPLVERPQPVSTSANQQLNHLQQDDDPDAPQPMGGIKQPTGCDRSQPASTKPRTPLKLVEHRPALDEFQTKVRDLTKAGFSERDIQKKTGATRHQVRQAKAAVQEHRTTSERTS
jgi:hypothetical protein